MVATTRILIGKYHETDMKRIALYFGMVAALAASCSVQEEDFKTPQQGDVIYYASFEQPAEEGTRVYANEDLLLRWTADDRVSIFGMNTYNQQYKFMGETGDYEGGFSKVDNPEFVTGDEIPHVVSVYPFQRQTRITEDEIITLNLPSEQFYAQNSFGPGANTMVSVSSGNLLKYRNVGGYLVFSLYGAGVSVSSITLKGNNGEKIAGKATVSMPVNGVPTASMANDAATEITLTCETPVRLGASAETPTRFWFVVPPVTFSKGFTITVCNSAGDTFEKSTSKSVTIERNNLAKMSPIKVDLPISNNVICYTSTDGEAVVPNNPDAFGAAIVSNEYVNGQGIIQFDGDVTVIGYNAFRSSRLSSITIPDSVTSIGDHAFSFCYDLASMTLPDSVTSIGEYAFLWCRSLSSITIPESVAVIKRYAFASCEGLSSLTIPGSVVSIGDVAFAWCKQISELTISEGVTSIGDCAFQECTSLSVVTIPDSVTSIGEGPFCLCSSLLSFNGKFASSDGKFLIDSGNLIQAASGAMVGHVVIPEGVTSIGDDAFNLCTGLTSIIIPESVEGIGDFAFQECTGLTSVIIPGSVANIGSSSFADCIHMSEVTISEGVKSISKGAFAGCVGLQTITVLPKVPPTGGNGMFINTGSCPIYVRCGSLDAYKAANYWREYADRIIGLDEHPDYDTLIIVDKDATPETKALFANLWAVADQGWMFGHHDDLWYGRYWYNQAGGSDTKAVCGDYPAVFSVDFAEIMDDRHGSDANAIRRRVILEARERGEVIIACMHLNNPKTGNSSWLEYEGDLEAAKKAVKEILTEGSATRTKYLAWLDRLADFALNLKDSRGNLVPVIFRPFHEHTQSWSWWGTECATNSEFVALWQLTIRYLRDTMGVHSFLYAISPQMDNVYLNAKDRLQYAWPGDDWVDFIGMDCYHGTNDAAFRSNIEALESLSLEKQKPCGVTETGKESFTDVDFWTRHIQAPVGSRRISMVTMWRNKYVGNNESDKHYYSVYPGHPSEDDFRKMYNDALSLFSRDLPDMYTLPEGYEIK